MPRLKDRTTGFGVALALVLGGLSLSACATKDYVNQQIEPVNTHLSAVDAKASDAIQRADAAAAAARDAGTAAQGAATDARTANQRLDQLTARVDSLEQRHAKRPRN